MSLAEFGTVELDKYISKELLPMLKGKVLVTNRVDGPPLLTIHASIVTEPQPIDIFVLIIK